MSKGVKCHNPSLPNVPELREHQILLLAFYFYFLKKISCSLSSLLNLSIQYIILRRDEENISISLT